MAQNRRDDLDKMLISTQELDALVAASGEAGERVVLLDARPSMAFIFSHIPGAVNVSWKGFSRPDSPVKSLLDSDMGRLEKKIGDLGVSSECRVVVYGDPFESWGADGRIYWMLTYLGHPQVQVLDGGWMKWKKEGRPSERGTAKPQAAQFSAQPLSELLATKEEVKEQVDAKDSGRVILDARAKEEYLGTASSGLPREGHVPGAKNLHWDSFYNADGTLKSPEDIVQIAAECGVDPSQEVMCYCTGGVRSAWLYFALRYAGFEKVRNYAGSWMEWSRDSNLPIEP